MNPRSFCLRALGPLLAAALQLVSALPLRADWPVRGAPVAPDLYPMGLQSVAGDPLGGAYFTLFYEGAAKSNYSVLRRIDPDGTLPGTWPSFLAIAATVSYPFAQGRVFPDGAGGIVTTGWPNWISASGGFEIERHDASGVMTVGWAIDGPAAPFELPYSEPVTDGAGGAFILRRTSDAIMGRHFLADGTLDPGWEPGGRLLVSAPAGPSLPSMVADGSGGMVVVWSAPTSAAGRVYALRLTSDGAPAPGWPAAGLRVSSVESEQTGPCFIATPSGVLIAWQDRRNGVDLDVYAQHVTSAGAIVSGWPAAGLAISSQPGDQSVPAIATDGLDGAVVAWEDQRSGPVSLFTVRITGAGSVAPGWTPQGSMVADITGGPPAMAPDRLGGAYYAWIRSGGNDHVRARHLAADGADAPGWPLEEAVLGYANEPPLIAPTGVNGAIVAWYHDQPAPDGQSPGTYAQRLFPDQVVPVTASTRSVEAAPERVRIVWDVVGAASEMPVFRRTPTSAWEAHGAAHPDGRDQLAFEDREIAPGARYAYALSEELAGAVWVDVPAAPTFSLEGFHPNPSDGAPTVAFTLDAEAPGRLEVFDLSGRRVSSREVGGQGSGRFVVAISQQHRLPPGVYHLRLSQGSRTLTARGIVIR